MSVASKLRGLLKPEYLFQPRVLGRRVIRRQVPSGMQSFRIPGGGTLWADADEEHGRILATLGVIDLPVTEALWRLTDPGEVCADVGANIGYMTGVFGARVHDGAVHSFEALSSIYGELTRNVEGFRSKFPNASFKTHCVAVSEKPGTVKMDLPRGFQENRGIARVGESGSIEVRAVTLDDTFPDERIGVMKLDVEGHELSVLLGAGRLLRERRVRDIVFEEHRPYPSDVTRHLQTMGYQIRRLVRPLTGPGLVDAELNVDRVGWLPQSFLATTDLGRAVRRFAGRRWRSLAWTA